MRPIGTACFLACIGFATQDAHAAGPDYRLEQVGTGVWVAIVNDAGLAGGNAGFIIGDQAVAVVDTFQDPRPAQALLADIRKRTDLPIRFVVNTHYHLDHVNGNDIFETAANHRCSS
jgi:glyoxylase-like metal-dependent hydrolase (beta-lactamase superfamily II)